MASASTPIKVDVGTDELISPAAHFLGKSKKDAVGAHRGEINAGIQAALGRLDGSSTSAVALLADVSPDQLNEYGGSI